MTGGAATSAIVAAWNFFATAGAGDYYQLMWSTADTHIRLLASTPSYGPAIPSVILTVNRIDTFLSNTGSFSGSFNGNFIGPLSGTASQAVSSSYALTASYVLNGGSGGGATTGSNTFSGSQTISGSLIVTGSSSANIFLYPQTASNVVVPAGCNGLLLTPVQLQGTSSVEIGSRLIIL
jgi:hypothetical protein